MSDGCPWYLLRLGPEGPGISSGWHCLPSLANPNCPPPSRYRSVQYMHTPYFLDEAHLMCNYHLSSRHLDATGSTAVCVSSPSPHNKLDGGQKGWATVHNTFHAGHAVARRSTGWHGDGYLAPHCPRSQALSVFALFVLACVPPVVQAGQADQLAQSTQAPTKRYAPVHSVNQVVGRDLWCATGAECQSQPHTGVPYLSATQRHGD